MRKEYSEKKNSEYSLYESSSRLKGCKSIQVREKEPQ